MTDDTDKIYNSLSADVKARLEIVAKKAILECLPWDRAIQEMLNTTPDLTRVQARAWYKRFLARTAKSEAQLAATANLNRGLLISRLEAAYTLAINRGDVRSAIAAAVELGKTQGVAPVKESTKASAPKIEASSINILSMAPEELGSLDELSDEQLRRALNRRQVSHKQAIALVKGSRGDYTDVDLANDAGTSDVIEVDGSGAPIEETEVNDSDI